MADPAPGAIWAARLTKELPTLASSSDTTKQPQPQQHLPTGVTCTASDVRLEDGVCRLVFRLVRPRPDASDEGAAAVAAAAAVSIDVDVRLDREESQYPFRPPVVRVLGGGAQWLPQSLVMAEKDDGGDDDDDGARRLRLPALEEAAWTPNAGVVDLLGALMEALARGPDGDGTEEEEAGGEYGPGQVISTKAFGGTILPCTVRQQGGVVLPRYVGVADEWVLQLEADRTRLEAGVVVHAQPMLNVAKLKYRRGESLTVVFKDNSRWDLQMAASGDCVAAIQAAMGKLGVTGRKTSTSALQQVERARALVQEARRIGGGGGEEEAEAESGGDHAKRPPPPPLTLERVQKVVDLYRESIECFASVSDDRRQPQEVMAMLHAFLSRPAVQAVLEQAPPLPPAPPTPSTSRGLGGSGGSSGGGGVGAFMTRLQAGVPKGLGLPPRKGPVLPRLDAALHAGQEEDDGLAREENLLTHGLNRLKKSLLDLGLGQEGGGSARERLGSRGSDGGGGGLDLSVSEGSAATSEGGAGAGAEARGSGRDDSESVGAVLEELDRAVAEATKEFEKLSSPDKPGLGSSVAGEGEEGKEGEVVGGGVSAAAALEGEGEGEGKGTVGAGAEDEEEIVI